LSGATPKGGSYVQDRELQESRQEGGGPSTKPHEYGLILAQEIPVDIRVQRNLLEDFYAAWFKEKFGNPEVTWVGTWEQNKLQNGFRVSKDFISSCDSYTSGYSQMACSFLLFANAYPKHAPLCYILADSSFTMAKVTSHFHSDSWKLIHHLTMSSITSDLDIIISTLKTVSQCIGILIFWYMEIYKTLCEHVVPEREEQFQSGYKQLPAETQISAFFSWMGDAQAMLKETMKQMKQLLPPEGDASEQEDRPGPSSVGDECAEAKMETEESEETQKLRGFLSRVESLERDMRAFIRLIRKLHESECWKVT
jgi:hypothetical protein